FLLCLALVVEGLHTTSNHHHLIPRNPQSSESQSYPSVPYSTNTYSNPTNPEVSQPTPTNTVSNPVADSSDLQTDLACYACWKGCRNKLPLCKNITEDQWNNFYNNPNDPLCANCLCNFSLNYSQVSNHCASDCSKDLGSKLANEAAKYITQYKCNDKGVSGLYNSNNIKSDDMNSSNSTNSTTSSSSSASYMYYSKPIEKDFSF
ncbi:17629_t:CDS:1, partial [Gigaspora rosea]